MNSKRFLAGILLWILLMSSACVAIGDHGHRGYGYDLGFYAPFQNHGNHHHDHRW